MKSNTLLIGGGALLLLVASVLVFQKNKDTPLSSPQTSQEDTPTKPSRQRSSRSSSSDTQLSSLGLSPAQEELQLSEETVRSVSRQARNELEELRPQRLISQEDNEQFRDEMLRIRSLEDPTERQAAMAAFQQQRQEQRQEAMERRREEMRERRASQAQQTPQQLAAKKRLQQTAELENLLQMGRSLGATNDFDHRLARFAETIESLSDEQLDVGVSEFRAELTTLRQAKMQARRQQREELGR